MKRPLRLIFTVSVFMLASLSIYTGWANADAAFEMSDLTLSSKSVKQGEVVTVAATVTNTGDSQGIYTLNLKLDDEIIGTQELSLAPGMSQTASFAVVAEKTGDHIIELNGEIDFLTVESSSGMPFPPYVWIIAGLMVLVIILLIIDLTARQREKKYPAVSKTSRQVPQSATPSTIHGTPSQIVRPQVDTMGEIKQLKRTCPVCGAENPHEYQSCEVCQASLSGAVEADTVTPLTETGPIYRPMESTPQSVMGKTADRTTHISEAWQYARITKLIDALVNGRMTEFNPAIDPTAPSGFTYHDVDRLLDTSGEESMQALELLARDNVLLRKPFEKLKVDPEGSYQLVPVERCPYCGSGNLTKGQLLEHFNCGNVQLDQEYMHEHRYFCPKCKKDLKLLGTDYRYVGAQYKCLNCDSTFPAPITKWRNMQNGKVWTQDELREVQLYSYNLNPEKRDWLGFQLKPKTQLVDFLKQRDYQVQEFAEVPGTSGAMHTIDILATRDDKLIRFQVGIGFLTALSGEREVRLEELFKFDTIAYDIGLTYKVVIAMPRLNAEAMTFAQRQKIEIFEANDPDMLISFFSKQPQRSPSDLAEAKAHYLAEVSSNLSPQAQIASFLKYRGYEVSEMGIVNGKSGATHTFDIVATRDDLLVKPTIAVAIATDASGLGVDIDILERFDARAFDVGIRSKVFVAVPEATSGAQQFAKQQRIRLLNEQELSALIRPGEATL